VMDSINAIIGIASINQLARPVTYSAKAVGI
jgi:hypothetical protein